MKTSDINTIEVLNEFAKHQGQWCFWYDNNLLSFGFGEDKQCSDILMDYSKKVVHSFFKKMVKQGYLGGCGCRGDFEITDKGLELINQQRTKQYTGY